MLDLNHNGIPDYQEPKLWLFLGKAVSTVIKMFAPAHTVAYRVADLYQRATEGGSNDGTDATH